MSYASQKSLILIKRLTANELTRLNGMLFRQLSVLFRLTVIAVGLQCQIHMHGFKNVSIKWFLCKSNGISDTHNWCHQLDFY